MWDILIYMIVSAAFVFICKTHILKIIRYFNYQYKFWVYFLWVTLVSFIVLPVFALRRQNVKNSLILAKWYGQVTKFIGIKWHFINDKVLGAQGAAVVVANHQNSLDLLGICMIWHVLDKAVVVVKKEVIYWFPFGLVTYLIGTVFVNRKRPQEAFKELHSKADFAFKNKIKIMIYPEGTRNPDPTKDGGTLLPFKKGAFQIAVASQVPIIPLVFSPYYFINSKQRVFNKGHITIRCLEPVSTEGLTQDDVPDLIERVQNMMLSAYKESVKEPQNNNLLPVSVT